VIDIAEADTKERIPRTAGLADPSSTAIGRPPNCTTIADCRTVIRIAETNIKKRSPRAAGLGSPGGTAVCRPQDDTVTPDHRTVGSIAKAYTMEIVRGA